MAAGVVDDNGVGGAKQSECLELTRPGPFDAPLASEDYPGIKPEHLEFIADCQRIFSHRQKGLPFPPAPEFRDRVRKMKVIRNLWWDNSRIPERVLSFHLHAMLEFLHDPLLVYQAGYFDQESKAFIAPSTHPQAPVPEIIQQPLLAWYSAVATNCQIREDRCYSSAQIQHLQQCMEWVKSPRHAEGILAMILATKDFVPKEYIEPALLLGLRERFFYLPHMNLLAAAVTLRRHDYVLANVANKEFFKGLESRFLTEACKGAERLFFKKVTIAADDSLLGLDVNRELRWNAFDLLKIAAHLVTMAHPKFEVGFPELAEYDNHLLNRYCTGKLIAQGFLNSEGMMIEHKVSIVKEGKKQCTKAFAVAYGQILESYGIPLTITGEALARQLHAWVGVEYPAVMAKKKMLDGLPRVDAIAALSLLVAQADPFPWQDEIVKLTRHCFELSARANALKEVSKKTEQEQQCFALAKDIVAKLKATPQSFIFQARFPDGERHHVFYVAIRHQEDDTGEIILVNGGGLASTFHQPDERLIPSEMEDKRFGNYHPMIIKLPTMAEEQWKFVRHYVYCLLSLHIDDLGGKAEDYAARLHRIIGNLYLCRQGVPLGKFTGYQNYSSQDYRSEPHPRVYRAQLAGNCTIYNYKQLIKIVFNLDEINYGVFEDRLVQSMDQLISQCIAPAAVDSGVPESKGEAITIKETSSPVPFCEAATDPDKLFAQLLLNEFGVNVKPVPKNGHCQFQAIAEELKRNGEWQNYSVVELTHRMRKMAVGYMKTAAGRETLLPFFNSAECNGCSTYDAYLEQMANVRNASIPTGAYGNEMTLVALGASLSLPIIVLHPEDFAPGVAHTHIANRIFGCSDLTTLNLRRALYLVYDGGNHYDTVHNVSEGLVKRLKECLGAANNPSAGPAV